MTPPLSESALYEQRARAHAKLAAAPVPLAETPLLRRRWHFDAGMLAACSKAQREPNAAELDDWHRGLDDADTAREAKGESRKYESRMSEAELYERRVRAQAKLDGTPR